MLVNQPHEYNKWLIYFNSAMDLIESGTPEDLWHAGNIIKEGNRLHQNELLPHPEVTKKFQHMTDKITKTIAANNASANIMSPHQGGRSGRHY